MASATTAAANTGTQTINAMRGAPPLSVDSPFSSTTWQALRILTFYRVILAGLLSVLYFVLQDSNPFNVQLPRLFGSTLLSYLVFSLAVGFSTRLQLFNYQFQASLQILADIGAIALLMHATGGVTSSLSVLLVVAVAAGTLLLPGRLAYLFAAVATLALLYQTGLTSLSLASTGAGDITRAGLLGLVLFAAAGLSHVLAIRIRESEALARQRGIDLANLQQLNQYIIQQLQSGVLVVDPDNNIRLANDTARTLLGLNGDSRTQLETISPELTEQLVHWKSDPQWQPQTVQSHSLGGALIPRFSALKTARGSGALILLEDGAQIAQQTQQIKLASLGRLSASIAHEIRNPLGAISHAAQLLAESEHLAKGDQRLTEIIGNHTRRVNTVIESVLQLSRRSASHPQQLLLQDWLAEFREEFVQMENIPPQQLELEFGAGDIRIQFDPGQLRQVLTNLCQNGLRYGADKLRVCVHAHAGEKGIVYLDVTDNGSGIDPETAEKMFEPFYTTAASGTGLGLYIARELCELNQARLSYQPARDKGSCFRIRFSA